MKIGKFTFDSNLILPAIAGYSDVGMRVLSLRFGAALAFTEMVSAKGLVYGGNSKELLFTHIDEKIKAVQLFGSDPEIVAIATELPLLQKFDIIDLNFGCPVPKIVKNGEGSALLNNPELIYKIVKAVKNSNPNKEVTAKIRLGFSKDRINAKEVAIAVEEAGAAAITVHGRTRDQFYLGVANYEEIRKVKETVKNITVIANGDVKTKEDYNRILLETGCDGVAVARGALGRPYIFSTLLGKSVEFDIYNLISEHLEMLLMRFNQKTAVNNIKKHIAYYCKGHNASKRIKINAFTALDKASLLDSIKELKGNIISN